MVNIIPQTTLLLDVDALGPALFDIISKGKETFTIEDVKNCLKKYDEIGPYLKNFDSPVLFKLFEKNIDDPQRQMAFDEISSGASFTGTLSRGQWGLFLESVKEARNAYLEKMFLVQLFEYAGHGLEPGGAYNQFVVAIFKVRVFLIESSHKQIILIESQFPRGLLEDFIYFARNHHPLFVVCCANKQHPFGTWKTRLTDFFSAFVSSFFGGSVAVLCAAQELNLASEIFLILLIVTIPSTIMSKVSFYSFAAPCLINDESKTSCNCCFACARSIGAILGYIIVIPGYDTFEQFSDI